MSAYTPEEFEKMLLTGGTFALSEQYLIDTVRDRDATIARLTKYVGSQMFRSDFKTADEMRSALDVANEVTTILAAECRAWRTDPELSGYEGTATRTCVAATNSHPAARKAVEEAKP